MALKEDYKDAVFAGLRKYKMLDNGDGTVSPVDMTEYEAAGDKFGAKDVNAITKMVNCTGDAFDPGRDYEVGDYTIYDNTVWKFTTAHPAGEWDESHVEKTRILVEIAEQNKNFEALSEKMHWRKVGSALGFANYVATPLIPSDAKELRCIIDFPATLGPNPSRGKFVIDMLVGDYGVYANGYYRDSNEYGSFGVYYSYVDKMIQLAYNWSAVYAGGDVDMTSTILTVYAR